MIEANDFIKSWKKSISKDLGKAFIDHITTRNRPITSHSRGGFFLS
jgi:hypothetical protein